MKKTAAKTLTYSLMHLVVAFSVAYALTRDWRAALAIGMVEPVFQTIAFALHERAWERAERRGARRRTLEPLRSQVVR
ncbi:DUF2061 domain-containing protein [Phenylobacterium sp.]|uniref:DUF2061 domain-containing protein n=1 Tax=Phenylobacterium sp. TaxID=1871053 RepID=UPI002BD38DF3|nr:DUF2061 domain-containing protein [Phenylobacterium sp.]